VFFFKTTTPTFMMSDCFCRFTASQVLLLMTFVVLKFCAPFFILRPLFDVIAFSAPCGSQVDGHGQHRPWRQSATIQKAHSTIVSRRLHRHQHTVTHRLLDRGQYVALPYPANTPSQFLSVTFLAATFKKLQSPAACQVPPST
jgi:hypothetical protein